MSFFERLVHLLEYKVTTPKVFGTYHIICLLLTIVAAILLVKFFKNASDRTIRILLFAVWCTITILEICKQLESSFDLDQFGYPVWSYLWHSFPFQFCSTPYYCLPFMIFLPEGFVRRAFTAFFAGFSFFAGLVVMIYPGDVFCATLVINIQTMILHGSMVALGILMVAHSRKQMKLRYFAGSLAIFYVFAIIAIILNETLYQFVLIDMPSAAVNLFFISRYYPCTLPILSDVYKAVPYGWYLVIYFVGFTFASALIYFIEKGILLLIEKIGKKKA